VEGWRGGGGGKEGRVKPIGDSVQLVRRARGSHMMSRPAYRATAFRGNGVKAACRCGGMADRVSRVAQKRDRKREKRKRATSRREDQCGRLRGLAMRMKVPFDGGAQSGHEGGGKMWRRTAERVSLA
jgi:hypothetical protein